jgi:hypothetical protein
MGKIDEVKEILNTLWVWMSLSFGAIVLLIGSVIKRWDDGKADLFFWLGVLLVFTLMFALIGIMKQISRKTKEIKDL